MLSPFGVLLEDTLQRSKLLGSLKEITKLLVYDMPIAFITPYLQEQSILFLNVVRRA
jgi:hypothetical protein